MLGAATAAFTPGPPPAHLPSPGKPAPLPAPEAPLLAAETPQGRVQAADGPSGAVQASGERLGAVAEAPVSVDSPAPTVAAGPTTAAASDADGASDQVIREAELPHEPPAPALGVGGVDRGHTEAPLRPPQLLVVPTAPALPLIVMVGSRTEAPARLPPPPSSQVRPQAAFDPRAAAVPLGQPRGQKQAAGRTASDTASEPPAALRWRATAAATADVTPLSSPAPQLLELADSANRRSHCGIERPPVEAATDGELTLPAVPPKLLTEAVDELYSGVSVGVVRERADEAIDRADPGPRRGGSRQGAKASRPECTDRQEPIGRRLNIPAEATATAPGIDAEAVGVEAAAMAPAPAAAEDTAAAVAGTSAGDDELPAELAPVDVNMVAATSAPVSAATEGDLPGVSSHAIADPASDVAQAAALYEFAAAGADDRAIQQHDRRAGVAPSQGQGLAGSKRLLEASVAAGSGDSQRPPKRQQPADAHVTAGRTSDEQELALAVLLQVLRLHQALADAACCRRHFLFASRHGQHRAASLISAYAPRVSSHFAGFILLTQSRSMCACSRSPSNAR